MHGGIVVAALLWPAMTLADSWSPPAPTVYESSNKTWRFTVTPRAIKSPLAYFQDKVSGHADAGKPLLDPQRHAWAVMQHLEHGEWRIAWTGPLVNEVSPVSALVSPSGVAVTFDNWHSVGYGDDAVVIYDGHGKRVRAMSLKDFLPPEYIRALPHSVSSIWWAGEHRISADGNRLILRIVVPSSDTMDTAGRDKPKYVELAFNLATGRKLAPVDVNAWATAQATAKQVDQQQREQKAKQEAAFRAPLLAPCSDAEVDWHQYLRDAFFRLDPDWQDTFPGTEVLPRPDSKNYSLMLRYLKEALHDDLHRTGVLMIASPSQDNLVRVLTTILHGVPDGWFKDARIYIAVDDAHTTAVAKLLAHTDAQYVQLNPDQPIPQRKARLDLQQASESQ